MKVSKKLRKRHKKAETRKENECAPDLDNANNQGQMGSSTREEPIDVNVMEKETSTNKELDTEADESIRDTINVDEPIDVNMMEKETLANEELDTEADESIRDTSKVDEAGLDPTNLTSNKVEVDDRNNIDDYGHQTDDSSDEQPTMADEVDFKVSTLVSALASNSIIQKLCWLLKFYKTNSIATNHYIITVLRRICDDLELSPMLYQVSIRVIHL